MTSALATLVMVIAVFIVGRELLRLWGQWFELFRYVVLLVVVFLVCQWLILNGFAIALLTTLVCFWIIRCAWSILVRHP